MNRIKIGISSCLLGEPVRYDGTDKYQPLITKNLVGRFEWVSVCPEMAIGMPAPRPPIQRVMVDGDMRLLRADDATFDLTDTMRVFATQSVEQLSDLSGFIFKTRSPSCGLTGVKLFNQNGAFMSTGEGAFAEVICSRMPELPVVEESELSSQYRVQKFADRVKHYHRLRFRGVD